LGLCSRLPLWRRRVKKCTQCGTCASKCPTKAIVAHSECITCHTCINGCHVKGAVFSFKGEKTSVAQGILPSRRAFIVATGGGAGLASFEFLDLRTLINAGDKGFIYPEIFIRPPGAIPEKAFLAACLRCGLCMRICPSNGLQPAMYKSGVNFGGKFSPVLVSRRGPCDPNCNLCGIICPTGAIRELPLREKRWAKIGTAVVHQGRCLAWNNSKSCMVCQEVCPYGAVNILPRTGAAALTGTIHTSGSQYPVPVVNANKCFGCGYCEQHCPTKVSAIIIEPLDALRLAEGSYEDIGRERGFQLDVLDKSASTPESLFPIDELPEGTLPPGFTD
jgi:MauM/NapG family ferredoxin protein